MVKSLKSSCPSYLESTTAEYIDVFRWNTLSSFILFPQKAYPYGIICRQQSDEITHTRYFELYQILFMITSSFPLRENITFF